MKEYASEFYQSKAWRKVRRAYMESQHYICERCGAPAVICHHKKHITPKNITNPEITLNFDNLEALCMDCHNKEHMSKSGICIFDEDGNVIGEKNAEIEEFKAMTSPQVAISEKKALHRGPYLKKPL